MSGKLLLLAAALLLPVMATRIWADQVEMQNGDRYVGKVISLNAETLTLQNELLGTLRLPRAKVAAVSFGSGSPVKSTEPSGQTNVLAQAPVGAPSTTTNAGPDFSKVLRNLGANSNLLQQVQEQFLSGAGGEAKTKFNEMVGGLMSGKLNVSDIRAEAQSAATQLRALKKELGDDAGWALDGYLSILDHFLKETAPAQTKGNPVPTPAPKAKSGGLLEEE
ncbi:MAG TPA: hypothetical protein VNT26_01460 [Candidatus Sulfotelmatobacter sp.]|nr:hypothetical protein [Candidatus Sulfotelmatobacter sp.]